MGLFCCRQRPEPPPPEETSPPKSPIQRPKLARRRSAPRPRASKQDIESFYRQGRELLRAEQENQERARLREILRQEREQANYDDDAVEAEQALEPADGVKVISPVIEESTPSRSDGDEEELGRRRFSFEDDGGRTPLYAYGDSADILSPDASVSEGIRLSAQPSVSGVQLSATHKGNDKQTEHLNEVVHAVSPTDPPVCQGTDSDKSKEPPTPAIIPCMIPSIAGTIDTIEQTLPAMGPVEPSATQVVLGHTGTGLVSPANEGKRELSPTIDKDGFLLPPKLPFGKRPNSHSRTSSGSDVEGQKAGNPHEGKLSMESMRSAGAFYTPDELFSQISTLVKPSTSTFMTLASSSSQVQLERPLPKSPTSEKGTVIRHRSSQHSLTHVRVRKQPSNSTLFLPTTPPQRYRSVLDSNSSFYPSNDPSRCQSLQDSLVDLPIGTDFSEFAESYPARNPMSPSLTPVNFGQRLQTVAGTPVEMSPGYSRFRFPWNASKVSARSLTKPIALTTVEPAVESQPESGLSKKSLTFSESVLKGSSNRLGTGTATQQPQRFSENSAGSSRSSANNAMATNSPRTNECDGSPSIKKPEGGLRSKLSWYSKPAFNRKSSELSIGKNDTKGLRSSFSIDAFKSRKPSLEKTPTVTKNDDLGSIGEEPSRFARLNKGSLIRSKSLTLRNSISKNMLRIRSKVSMTGGFRSVSLPKASAPQGPNGDNSEEVTPTKERMKEFAISKIEFEPTLPGGILAFDSGDEASDDSRASGGNGNMVIRRANTVRSLPTGPRPMALGRRSTSASRVGMRRRSTLYDDCVVFPFGDGEEEDDEIDESYQERAYYTPLSRPISRPISRPVSRSAETTIEQVEGLFDDALWANTQEYPMEARTMN